MAPLSPYEAEANRVVNICLPTMRVINGFFPSSACPSSLVNPEERVFQDALVISPLSSIVFSSSRIPTITPAQSHASHSPL